MSGMSVPDARPLHHEAVRNRLDRPPTHSTCPLQLEDCSSSALGGNAQKRVRPPDHPSQHKRQPGYVPCCRTGQERSLLIRRADRSSFVAFGRFAVFVAWHFLNRLLKYSGPSPARRFGLSSRRENAAIAALRRGFATQNSARRSVLGDRRSFSASC